MSTVANQFFRHVGERERVRIKVRKNGRLLYTRAWQGVNVCGCPSYLKSGSERVKTLVHRLVLCCWSELLRKMQLGGKKTIESTCTFLSFPMLFCKN